MKILQLNVWNGRINGGLMRLFEEGEFDLVCIQEAVWGGDEAMLRVFAATVDQISAASRLKHVSKAANFTIAVCGGEVAIGNAVLSRDRIVKETVKQIYGKCTTAKNVDELCDHGYTAQLIELQSGLYVVNYHGYWLPSPVGDETTTAAMRKVANMIKRIDGPLVMCGDLNVIHAAPAMRELDFLRDLTEEYDIDNTLAGLKFDGKVACDHILVNSKVQVEDFRVLEGLVSDHKGLVAMIKYKKELSEDCRRSSL